MPTPADTTVDRSARTVFLLYGARDLDGLTAMWHEHIEIRTADGRAVSGKGEAARLMRELWDDPEHVPLPPSRVMMNGDYVLIEGSHQTSTAEVAIAWLWRFENGLLRESISFHREQP